MPAATVPAGATPAKTNQAAAVTTSSSAAPTPTPTPAKEPEDDEDCDDDEDEEDEDEKFPDDEKTEFGSASGSKFSTKRGGTLRNHAKRQLGANGDLETRMANSPGRKSPEVDKKVRMKCFHSQRGTLFSGR